MRKINRDPGTSIVKNKYEHTRLVLTAWDYSITDSFSSKLKHKVFYRQVQVCNYVTVHQHMAQCCANIQPSFMCTNSLFGFSLGSQKYSYNHFSKSEHFEKMTAWSEGYTFSLHN